MKLKQTALASAVSALALGASGQAAADVYAYSSLIVDQLFIDVTNAVATNFNLDATNTAFLNGAGDVEGATCAGTVGGAHNCGPAGTRLDPQPANAPGSNPILANNTFTKFGPTGTDYSNADSVVRFAQLLNDGITSTQQKAESNISSGSSASASAQIQSTTGFTFVFDVTGPDSTLTMTFLADPHLQALINEGIAGTFGAQANLNTSFTLQQNTGGTGFVNWNPQGTAANDCIAVNGPTCVELFDTQDLNINVGTTADGTNETFSAAPGLTLFGIQVTGLTAGQWTLTLNAVTSTLVTRLPEEVPEPNVLALLGIGLAGLGMLRRRSRAQK